MTSARGKQSTHRGIWWIVAFFAVVALLYWKQQDISDWYRLRNYSVPARVAKVAQIDAMTLYGQRLFYVNRPEFLAKRADFATKCPIDMEKTIILGCYLRNDRGMYLYDVTDPRLKGVVETTAAHEMLHAGYARLSSRERSQVDSWLKDFAKHRLKDTRIKKTLAAYQASRADLGNEMHSIFATEVPTLTPQLEAYYKRYFTDRGKVIAEMQRYQAEFTSREDKVKAYDVQLRQLKLDLDALEKSLRVQLVELDRMQAQMSRYESTSNFAAYNAMVGRYNESVDRYNTELDQAQDMVKTYNQTVASRNAVATEERQLVDALSGDTLPAKKW